MVEWKCGLRLTRMEGRYLYALTTPVGKAVSADDFVSRAHEGDGNPIDRKSVNSHVGRLRGKMAALDVEIETIYGVGWRISDLGGLDLPWNTNSERLPPESEALDFFLDALEARRRARGGEEP